MKYYSSQGMVLLVPGIEPATREMGEPLPNQSAKEGPLTGGGSCGRLFHLFNHLTVTTTLAD